MRHELGRVEIPDEHEARVRGWTVVEKAFAQRTSTERRRPSWRPLAAAAVAAAVVAGTLSSPGRAVLGDVRDAVLPGRIERTQPALFSLPAPGRLLVVSAEGGGVWVVGRDGARRRLGDFDDASWSPYGRYVVATRRNGLTALTPEGEERWSLARPGVHSATWGGTRSDTRIAYLARDGLHVVGGDGRNDRLLAPEIPGPFAWRPGFPHQLAYLSASELRLQDADSGRVIWRGRAGSSFAPLGLSWSADGQRVLVAFERELLVLDGRGRRLRRIEFPRSEIVAASFAPAGRAVGLVLRWPGTVTSATKASVRVLEADGRNRGSEIFSGRGDLGELAWSPDGRFLLVAWRSADRWLFVNRSTRYAIAVDDIGAHFERADGRPPLLVVSDRWCCGR